MNPPLQLVIEAADNLGDRIEQARLAKRWSQKQLGDAIGRSRGAIGNWEGGDPVPSDMLIAIARALGRPVAWFVDGLDGQVADPTPDGDPSVTGRYRGLRAVRDSAAANLTVLPVAA